MGGVWGGGVIPVYQTMTVGNDGSGNCVNACVASILELPLRDVLQIMPRYEGDYWGEWESWLAARGLEFGLRACRDEVPPKGYAIASGLGGRVYPEGHERAGQGISHAVVVFNGELIHDPYPGGKGIDRARHYWTISPLSAAGQ